MNKKKDIFAEVEEAAKKKLTDPDCKGAARTVLNYISEQRKKTQNGKQNTNKMSV